MSLRTPPPPPPPPASNATSSGKLPRSWPPPKASSSTASSSSLPEDESGIVEEEAATITTTTAAASSAVAATPTIPPPPPPAGGGGGGVGRAGSAVISPVQQEIADRSGSPREERSLVEISSQGRATHSQDSLTYNNNNNNNNGSNSGLDLSVEKLTPIIEEVSLRYLEAQNTENQRNQEQLMNNLSSALKKWSEQISSEVKKISTSQTTSTVNALTSVVSSNMNTLNSTIANNAAAALSTNSLDRSSQVVGQALGDVKDRQAHIIEEIKEAHKKQLEILKQAIVEERYEAAQAQQVFEETLQTKYSVMVSALQEKIRAEQEASMQRALNDLEKAARAEGDRARQQYELQQSAELAISAKFKAIVADLRKSWEEEETGRARHLEERLRSHYSAVLEHMEAQLSMALQLQDDADRQWMEDVEARNRQQVATIKAFEEKCRHLYDQRLAEYAEKTDKQLAQYEEQLLESGSLLAAERSKFDSKQRRMKLACTRWKLEYQRETQQKFSDCVTAMENQYLKEIAKLLEQLDQAKRGVVNSGKNLLAQEAALKERLPQDSNGGESAGWSEYAESAHSAAKKAALREELQTRWSELNTPVEERVQLLTALLDAAPLTSQLASKYENVLEKLSARVPIAQMLDRRQYIEYKLKLALRAANNASSANSSDVLTLSAKAELMQEAAELSKLLEAAVREYESTFGEKYVRVTAGAGATPTPPSTAATPLVGNGRSVQAAGSPYTVSSTKAVQQQLQQQQQASPANKPRGTPQWEMLEVKNSMPVVNNLLTAVILAPLVAVLSALSLASLQRGLEWIAVVAKTPQKGYLKELKPFIKHVDVVLDRIFGGQKFTINTTAVLLMAVVVLLLCLLLENAEKPKNVKVVKASEKKD